MPDSPTPGRRSVLRAGAALGALGTLTALNAAPSHAATTRKPVIVGANPGIQLFDSSGACTAYASVWRVDWSTHGSGHALMLWTPGGITVSSGQPHLARLLWDDYTSQFPEIEGLPAPAPTYRHQHVTFDLDLASGFSARAGDTTVRMEDVLDRRWVDVPEFPFSDRSESLNLVFAPCDRGSIFVAGRALPGSLARAGTTDRPWTSAFVSEAEVWRR